MYFKTNISNAVGSFQYITEIIYIVYRSSRITSELKKLVLAYENPGGFPFTGISAPVQIQQACLTEFGLHANGILELVD